jgi:lysyl-tRNA synthetase class I
MKEHYIKATEYYKKGMYKEAIEKAKKKIEQTAKKQ